MRTLPPNAPKSFRLAPLAGALAAAIALPSMADTYSVTSTADSGPGTLRQIIANSRPPIRSAGCDPNVVINFAFPGAGPFLINLSSGLGTLGCPPTAASVTINGQTATGYVANSSSTQFNGSPVVIIDGSSSTFGCGLDGSFLYGGTLTVTGITMQNWQYGGAICGGGLGSGLAVRGSVISGNSNGISLASNSTIGGAALANRNVIISNAGYGIGGSTGNATIQNNFIGVNVLGQANGGTPNGKGIMASSSGPVTVSNNYISGNSLAGVEVTGMGWTIQNNKIGVDTAGSPAGNGGFGIGMSVNTGSASAITNNVIANNSSGGIAISAGTGVRISQNSIYANSPGIQLGTGGAPNDAGDADSGPNDLQNSPNITGVNQSAGNTIVTFNFVTAPGTYVLEFFENGGTGLSEGQTYIGSQTVTVSATGTQSGSFTASGLYQHVSATARESTQGNTSEFWPSVAFIPSPAVTVSPSGINFGSVAQGGSSPPRTITYTSSGTGNWHPSFITISSNPSCIGGPIGYGGYMYTTDCDTEVGQYAPGTGCSAQVRFAPINLGQENAYFCVFDNSLSSGGGYSAVPLTGIGVVPPTLTLQPSTYDFGSVSVRTSSPVGRFILRNSGSIPVDFTVSLRPPFTLGDTTCRSPLDPGIACALTATFTPLAEGLFSEQLTVTPSVGSAAFSQLFGQGVVGPALQLPNSMEFLYSIGNEPTLQDLRIVNTGTAPLTINSIRVSGTGFTLVNPCPPTLAPNEGCTLTLGFSSNTTGQTQGALTVDTNAAGGQQVVQLFGLSQARPVPLIDVSPREMGYGTRSFGTTSPTQTITVRNIGGATAIVNSIVASPDYVVVRNTCTVSLAPLASCEADIAMSAAGYGQRPGSVTVNANDERSPHSVNLLGTSCRASGLILGRLGLTSGCAP